MSTRVYQLYGSSAVDANAVTYWTAPRRGTIKRISWAAMFVCTADGSTQNWELSFGSGWQGSTNDALGPIDRLVFYLKVITGVGVMDQSKHKETATDIEVVPGDRLYLNAGGTATCQGNIRVLIEVDERGGG